jgi:hypothetical protein
LFPFTWTAVPVFPVTQVGPPTKVAVFPFPEESTAESPVPSLKEYETMGAAAAYVDNGARIMNRSPAASNTNSSFREAVRNENDFVMVIPLILAR